MRSTKGKAMGAAFLGIPVVIAWVASGLATACTSSAVTPCDLADCTETGPGPDVSIPDSGKDGDVPPPGCDSLNDPLKNPEKCFTDENWAYVSPSGDDGGAGTKGKPFKSLKKALEGGKIRIAVCEGTYTESVDVTRDVTIQSGFSCDFTKAGAKAKVVGTKPDYAVSVAKPAGNVALRDLEVEAADGTASSVNSVAIVANDVTKVTLIGVSATAKKGFDGPAGAGGTTGVVSNLAAIGGTINGYPATGSTTPGLFKTCVCTVGGNTTGGVGGAPGGDGQNGAPPVAGSGMGGGGGISCNPNGNGGNGGSGNAGSAAQKSTTQGGIVDGRWVAGTGSPGEDGKSGQGGGGGGGRDASSAGGGGGCGGCGGSGGKGGGGGGASIAMVSISAGVVLERSTLKSGTGGTGGTGGGGGPGGSGGIAGCGGGDGGMGGAGGAGGGGAGGISYGVVYKGTKPTRTGTTVTAGTPGKGGANGAGVTEHGPAGTAGEELEAP